MTNLRTDEIGFFFCNLMKIGTDENKAIYSIQRKGRVQNYPIQSQFIVRDKVKQIQIKAARLLVDQSRVRSVRTCWCVLYTRVEYKVNLPKEATEK